DIEEFVQRFDLVVLVIMILFVFVKLVVLLFASGKIISDIFKINKDLIVYFILAIIISVLVILFGKSYQQIVEFRQKIVIPYIKSVFELFIPLLIVIISFIRKKKFSKDSNQLDYNS
ncbi:MAG: GerAB/ArcD/ProY family transporter, partial [Bacilli bacterium]|nr:GerAB/ArcD/ProY family transporter [Bacilli bacterium]